MGTILKDIDIAKQLLDSENLSICIVKEGEVIFKSSEKGVKPIYLISQTDISLFKGASIADRVIGKAAAIIFKHIGFKSIYTKIISEKAVDILLKEKIKSEKLVRNILNRKKTDSCPIEKLSEDIDDYDTLINMIGEFIERQDLKSKKYKTIKADISTIRLDNTST